MKQYSSLETVEKAEILNSAARFYKNHTSHVERLLSSEESAFVPSGSDMYHPEL